jgi:hypothetical protein
MKPSGRVSITDSHLTHVCISILACNYAVYGCTLGMHQTKCTRPYLVPYREGAESSVAVQAL